MLTLIVDGTNMAHRARYAYNLSFDGKDTSVTYGVFRMLMALIKNHKPDSIIVCWDGGTPYFRRKVVPSYKQRRHHELDADWAQFLEQLEELENIIPFAGIYQIKRRGTEADDLMAAAAQMVVGDATIVTGDQDLLQCVTPNVSVMRPRKKGDVIYTVDNFQELVGYSVDCYVMGKALQGDSSDEIQGVPGIGPKTAAKLLETSPGTLEDVLDVATPRKRDKIIKFRDSGRYDAAYAAMDLGTDLCGARLAVLEAKWKGYSSIVYRWCLERGFSSIIEAGSLGAMFGSLKEPTFEFDNLRLPRVWDYKRTYKQQTEEVPHQEWKNGD